MTRSQPCPICQKDTWCLLHPEVILCMRVVSNRPKTLRSGETGYLHTPNGTIKIKYERKEQPKVQTLDCLRFLKQLREQSKQHGILAQRELAGVLKVSGQSLVSLGCLWFAEKRAWAFPMRSGHGGVVGIRLRSTDGSRKWAVPGSHQGVFLPYRNPDHSLCVVCEGPTDTAAALTLGFYSIGRPSCSGGVPELKQLVHDNRIKRVAIVADNDTPGLEGAKTLANQLSVPSCLLILPCKDVRQFLTLGGNKQTMECLINSCVWTQR